MYKSNSKVLISAPIYDGMSYCIIDFINHLKAINYDNFDIVLFDNSKSKKFFREIRKIQGVDVIYIESTEDKNILRLIQTRNEILDYARKNNYDYLLMMDADVMVPENILNSLIAKDKDIVSGLYFNYFNVDKQVKLLPVCYKQIEQDIYEELKRKQMVPDFVKSIEDFRRNITKEEIEKGELLEVLIPSAGCLLLSKKAINSEARYGLLSETNGLVTSDDIFFFQELRNKNFKLYCEPEIICKHAIIEKYKDGKTNEIYN